MREVDVRGKRFAVIGGARSGIAVAKLLAARDALVFLSDSAPAEKMGEALAELKLSGIPHEFGGHSESVLASDTIVISPGVPSNIPIVREALARSIKLVGEIEVASWFCRSPIVAVTGTNGKTTCTTLVGRMFEDAKRPAMVGGNIGVAFSGIVEHLDPYSHAILEISSFQLEHIETFRPKVAVLLNITPDHLDRYEQSFEQYVASKCRVFENQGGGDVIVYNWDDPVTRKSVEERLGKSVRRLPFSAEQIVGEGAFVQGSALRTIIDGRVSDIVPVAEVSIRGKHNLYNAMAATLAAQVEGISPASLRATLRNFKGVEHRLEFVRELDGVTYVNDSKATNVDSVWYALQSFSAPIVLLLGGRDKGNDYTKLLPLVRKQVKVIVAIGESADKVMTVFGSLVTARKASSMEEAVQCARERAAPSDVVLLSPACASFDWFENYEHRGRLFKHLVNAMEPSR